MQVRYSEMYNQYGQFNYDYVKKCLMSRGITLYALAKMAILPKTVVYRAFSGHTKQVSDNTFDKIQSVLEDVFRNDFMDEIRAEEYNEWEACNEWEEDEYEAFEDTEEYAGYYIRKLQAWYDAHHYIIKTLVIVLLWIILSFIFQYGGK